MCHPSEWSVQVKQDYFVHRTEHRGFVRYQRADYLLAGRVFAVSRRSVVLIRSEHGFERLRLQAGDSRAPSAAPLSLLLRRIVVRVVGQDSDGVLLALRWHEGGPVDQRVRRDVPPR
jgi:hypothetical protein